jgi:hypothetical protein
MAGEEMFELKRTVEVEKNDMAGIITRDQKNVVVLISQVAPVTEITMHRWQDL